MPKTTILTQTQYSKLLRDVRKIIEEGRKRAASAANQELVQIYWNVGKRISEEGLIENAGYGDAILEDLSDELGIDLSTLKRSIAFFQTYISAPSGTNLSWSHYRALLPINDKAERTWYEEFTADHGLTAAQLGKIIKEKKYEHSRADKGKKIQAQKLKRPTEATYIYKATVVRVIDGDTLYLRIDLGFQVLKEQRVRLADIDTPSIDDQLGKKAAKYVRDQLARVEFIMVKTSKIDIYGRYVGHIFYSTRTKNKETIFQSGQHLNQELADAGLARIV